MHRYTVLHYTCSISVKLKKKKIAGNIKYTQRFYLPKKREKKYEKKKVHAFRLCANGVRLYILYVQYVLCIRECVYVCVCALE